MVDYRYLLVDAATGNNLAELPLTVESFAYGLSVCESLSGTMPLDHPVCTWDNLAGGVREITVIRDDDPVWNGPITSVPDPSARNPMISITAREAPWHFTRRTLEVDKHYYRDIVNIAKALITYATTKTSTTGDGTGGPGADINAALPRLLTSGATAGVVKRLRISGAARMYISDLIERLCDDPDTGLEWRTNYTDGSTRQSCQRTIQFGAPLGTTRTTQLTEAVLYDYGRPFDIERAATRVHARGANAVTKTKQNTGSITDGWSLLELVLDKSDTSDSDELNDAAREGRRKAQPPVRTFWAEYIPNDNALKFNFCNVADTVPFEVTTPPLLQLRANNRRVVKRTVFPPASEGEPERLRLDFNLPLDELGV